MGAPPLSCERDTKGTHCNRSAPGIILLYHRVANVPSDPQLLAVQPAHFAAQMEVLAELAAPVTLAGCVVGRPATRPHVAVTFDDGYADNLSNALPVLGRYGISATVFVTGGPDAPAREFWWDELDALLLCPGRLPDRVVLSIRGREQVFELGSSAEYTAENYARYRLWNVLQPPPTARHTAYLELHSTLRPLYRDERTRLLDQLWHMQGRSAVLRPTHRTLAQVELIALGRSALINIGAHTCTHPVLALLQPAEIVAELSVNKLHLEGVLGRPVTTFSYPFGARRDYTPSVVEAVRTAGFTHACANLPGRVTPATDRLQMPRYIVRDWDGPTFARQLRTWLES